MTSEQWAEATVRIATGLLRWEDYDGYGFIDGVATTLNEVISSEIFRTLDGCAEFERELARRDMDSPTSLLWGPKGYICQLQNVRDPMAGEARTLLLATPEQRVRACLRVMEEAGL